MMSGQIEGRDDMKAKIGTLMVAIGMFLFIGGIGGNELSASMWYDFEYILIGLILTIVGGLVCAGFEIAAQI